MVMEVWPEAGNDQELVRGRKCGLLGRGEHDHHTLPQLRAFHSDLLQYTSSVSYQKRFFHADMLARNVQTVFRCIIHLVNVMFNIEVKIHSLCMHCKRFGLLHSGMRTVVTV